MAPEWPTMVGDLRTGEDEHVGQFRTELFYILNKILYHPGFPYIGAKPILVLYKYSMAPEWSTMVGDQRTVKTLVSHHRRPLWRHRVLVEYEYWVCPYIGEAGVIGVFYPIYKKI